jgi:hypothetical protein
MSETAQTRTTMTLTLQLPPEIEKQLLERAAQAGQSAEVLALNLIEQALRDNGATSHADKTFAEIFAPVREEFRQSGMTEDELHGLIEEARNEAWREKQARKGK